MNNKVLIICAGLLIIALVSAPVMAAAPANAGQPFDQILTLLGDIQAKMGIALAKLDSVLGKLDSVSGTLTTLQGEVSAIRSTTDEINEKISTPQSSGVRMLTRTKTVVFKAGTPKPPSGIYRLVDIALPGGKAADFRIQVATWGGDWTGEWGDILAVGKALGYGAHTVSTAPLYISDDNLDEGFWDTQFTANYMSIYVQFGDTLEKDVFVDYSYTVTTESGATIEETITDPPL